MARYTRPISWIKAAKKDFLAFPKLAQLEVLRALTIAAEGQKADICKPLKGLGSGVLEVALPHKGDAYRVIYCLKIDADIWVVHAFQKKSKTGIKTPKQDVALMKRRINQLKKALK